MRTFYQFEIALFFLVTIILSFISAYMFHIQIIAGIVFLIAGLFYFFCCFLVIVKTDVHDDRFVAHKLLSKKNIPLKNISSLTIENKHFIGEGRYSTRKALVIAYIEDAGYRDELILTYNNDLHHFLGEKLGQEKLWGQASKLTS